MHRRSTQSPASALIVMKGVSWWLATIAAISTTAMASIVPGRTVPSTIG